MENIPTNVPEIQIPEESKIQPKAQLIAGIDTSIDTVESYIEDIFT